MKWLMRILFIVVAVVALIIGALLTEVLANPETEKP